MAEHQDYLTSSCRDGKIRQVWLEMMQACQEVDWLAALISNGSQETEYQFVISEGSQHEDWFAAVEPFYSAAPYKSFREENTLLNFSLKVLRNIFLQYLLLMRYYEHPP